MSAFYGTPPPDEERFKLLDRAHELGCVHWDSAALYGDSEDLVGNWFERTGKRKDVRSTNKHIQFDPSVAMSPYVGLTSVV